MPTRVFIGSAQKNIEVARAVAKVLEEDNCAEVTVWDENVFNLGRGFLETLLAARDEFDFAVMIWGTDDETESKGTTTGSPRDNVVFECGLFMGALGRERVFVVHDRATKIPSDFAGITLAPYDGSRVKAGQVEAALRDACSRITRELRQSPFNYMVGEWKSRYRMTYENGHPTAEDVLEIKPARAGVSIVSKDGQSTLDDYYTAYARPIFERQLIGEWRSKTADAEGLFLLKIHPRNKIIYGYFTSPDEGGATVFATWVLARRDDGVDEAKVADRLKIGEQMLREETISFTTAAGQG